MDERPMAARTCQGLRYFFVNNDADFDASFGGRLQHPIQSVLLIPGRWPAQVQFRRQPPCRSKGQLGQEIVEALNAGSHTV